METNRVAWPFRSTMSSLIESVPMPCGIDDAAKRDGRCGAASTPAATGERRAGAWRLATLDHLREIETVEPDRIRRRVRSAKHVLVLSAPRIAVAGNQERAQQQRADQSDPEPWACGVHGDDEGFYGRGRLFANKQRPGCDY